MSRIPRVLPLTILLLGYQTGAADFRFHPSEIQYDERIPTLENVLGHGWGEGIPGPEQIEDYLQKLAQASEQAVLVPYAKSWEGRPLRYLVLSSRENMERLDRIKTQLQRLANPGKQRETPTAVLESLPAVVWLMYGVHGDEISSPNAALLTAYHLLAARNDEVAGEVLRNCIVMIDPLQNPDGRFRFVTYLRQTEGRWPDPDSQSAGHNQTWPGARTNHYLFDLNRDWFARTQPETRGRIETYLQWYPQVVVDFHEMDGESTYYFGPPAKPFNPEFTKAQIEWLKILGRNNARWFDRLQFDYFTREVFDSFYPGYGEDWPMLHGSIGMTYEQASTGGMMLHRDDETTLRLRESVKHHFIASLSTLEGVARNRRELLEYFADFRKSALTGKGEDPIAEFILVPGSDPKRVRKLVENLLAQGIQVGMAEESFSNPHTFSHSDSRRRTVDFPAGAYLIPTAQPAGRLARTLLSRQVEIDKEFLQQQKRRIEKHLEPEFYDLTGWSLPLLFDLECYVTETPSKVATRTLQSAVLLTGELRGEANGPAYLIPWGTNSAVGALSSLHRQDIRVFASDKRFKLNGVDFPRGSLIVKVRDNPADLYERLRRISIDCGVMVHPARTSWVEEGVNFGSRKVHYLKKPRVAITYNLPTLPNSLGAIRFLMEQVVGYPATVIQSYLISETDLSRYNVLILPDQTRGPLTYSSVFGEKGIAKIRRWVDQGGTLVAVGQATQWLTQKEVGLLATKRETRFQTEQKAAEEKPPSQPQQGEEDEEELPLPTPGAIMRVSLDTDHWLTAGYDGDTNVIVNSRRIFPPLAWDKGRNPAVYKKEQELLASGFVWDEARKQLAGKAYLMHQKLGKGHVIAFAEDPTYRAFVDGLNLLFFNAVFFGPSH